MIRVATEQFLCVFRQSVLSPALRYEIADAYRYTLERLTEALHALSPAATTMATTTAAASTNNTTASVTANRIDQDSDHDDMIL